MRRMRLRTKAGLIAAALTVQAIVLTAGWLLTFRVVQRSFAQVIQERTIEQTRDYADRIASLIPDEATRMPVYGSPQWQTLQDFIMADALRELPDGGFACVIEADGHILCHPEIEQSPGLRGYSFAGKTLRTGLEPNAGTEDLLAATSGADGERSAGGVVEFNAGDFHYVATKPIPGSDLRLLIHQPIGALVSVGAESTRFVMVAAGLSAVLVLGVTGAGLSILLRRYESVYIDLNRHMKENLRLARRIQESSLPHAVPRVPGYAFATSSEPAEETGGDTFDIVPISQSDAGACLIAPSQAGSAAFTNRIAFLLADATGHGVGPALAATQLNAMARLAWRMGSSLIDVARLVNEQLATRLPQGRFVTAVFGTLDSTTHTLEVFSAGQGPLMLWRSGSQTMEHIETHTYPLGVMGTLGGDSPTAVRLEPGDMFIALSDGIFEAMNDANEQFGVARVEAIVLGSSPSNPGAIAARILDDLAAFTAGHPADDDRTMLILQRTSP